MPRYACPICGDPNGYTLWIGKEPPKECPEGPHVRNITECPLQMYQARRRALWLRVCPEAFDAAGNLRPGQFGTVHRALERAGHDSLAVYRGSAFPAPANVSDARPPPPRGPDLRRHVMALAGKCP